MHLGTDADQKYTAQAQAIVNFRDKVQGGVLNSLDQLKGAAGSIRQWRRDSGWLLSFRFWGAQRGNRRSAGGRPVAYAGGTGDAVFAAGMLVYLGFRFEWIYGVAAVVTVFHDTLITVGAFSLTKTEISLTVIAAILTLIGYSNNDTIVVFDRIRENIKLMRREEAVRYRQPQHQSDLK